MCSKIKSIFKNITTLHGISQLKRHNDSRIFLWSAILVGNMLLTMAYIHVIRNRYKSDQIITRINANCKVNQVPFPAVSICNFNPVSLKRTAGITEILKNNNKTQREIENFYCSLPSLIHYRGSDENLDGVSEIMEILKHHYFNTETIMEEVHQHCEDLLLYCTFNSKKKNCNKMFNLIKTYEGHCCAFNYAALKDGNIDEISYDDDIEYYSDPSVSSEKSSGIFVTSESGRGSGLSVVLNVEPNDYPEWSLTPYNGAKILLNDPTDYPEITVLYKYVVIGQSLDIKVEPRIFQSDDDIRHVPLEKRNCAFHDEFLLQHTDRFSSETCKTECKMKNYADQCGCIPYKYPKEKALRICDFGDLECLNNLRAHDIEWEKDCTPICYIECRDKRYSITSDVMPLLADFYPRNITLDRNISELSSLQVYFAKSTCNCFQNMLLIDFNYFIATYGGVFSLCFGVSIITLFEVIYLFLSFVFRISCTYVKNTNKVIAKYIVFSLIY